ncbi:Brix-domain-containing protein [Neoconidiobolus thromboides FSU 785]|nr:Brix-domain-containing protein [Neoconidiobolus thromboides FSU 785]
MLRIVKPKNARSKRALEKREAQVVENVKTCLFVKGSKTSEIVNKALNDLYLLKKPDAIKFNKKNELRPFEDETKLEFLSKKNDASLMLFGSHSKKRPDNLTFVTFFNYCIYDMIEVGIQKAKFMDEFEGLKCGVGLKPSFLFNGEEFEQVEGYIKFKTLILNFFHGKVVDRIDLAGLEHVITVTASPTKQNENGLIHFRVYTIKTKKSGTKLPYIELNEMGPSLDFSIRRAKFADEEMVKQALRVPKELKPKKQKNHEHDEFGSLYGKVHMQKQDFGKLQTRKMKGLKKSISVPEEDNEEDNEGEDNEE